MRLLMINNEFPPLGGGTATANWMLFRELAGNSAVTIDLVTAAAGAEREEVAFADNIRLIRLPAAIRDIHHAGARELLAFTFPVRPPEDCACSGSPARSNARARTSSS